MLRRTHSTPQRTDSERTRTQNDSTTSRENGFRFTAKTLTIREGKGEGAVRPFPGYTGRRAQPHIRYLVKAPLRKTPHHTHTARQHPSSLQFPRHQIPAKNRVPHLRAGTKPPHRGRPHTGDLDQGIPRHPHLPRRLSVLFMVIPDCSKRLHRLFSKKTSPRQNFQDPGSRRHSGDDRHAPLAPRTPGEKGTLSNLTPRDSATKR